MLHLYLITNLLPDADDRNIKIMFHPFGDVIDIISWRSENSTNAIIKIRSNQHGNVLDLTNTRIAPWRRIQVRPILRPITEATHQVNGRSPTTFQVYVGNISYHTTLEDILNLFSRFGSVTGHLIPNLTAGCNKFGFLSFQNDMEAFKAIICMNGYWLYRRRLVVTLANNYRS